MARRALNACSSCHGQIDILGYGLENFDGVGLYRTMDHTKPVDASGEITGTDVDGPYSNGIDLVTKLAGSKTVHECLATEWFRYGYGREEDATADACTLQTLKSLSVSNGGNFQQLLLALTQTDTFLLRSKGDQP